MFINDLPENLTSDTRLFDDDAIVYCQIHSVEDQVILQNASKTSRMGTTMGHGISPTKMQLPQNLQIQKSKNIQIHSKRCHPSRGDIQSNLARNNPIDRVTKKSNNIVGFLRRKLRSVSSETNAYIKMVRSNLEYCTSAWNPHQKKYEQKIPVA